MALRPDELDVVRANNLNGYVSTIARLVAFASPWIGEVNERASGWVVARGVTPSAERQGFAGDFKGAGVDAYYGFHIFVWLCCQSRTRCDVSGLSVIKVAGLR